MLHLHKLLTMNLEIKRNMHKENEGFVCSIEDHIECVDFCQSSGDRVEVDGDGVLGE